MLFISCWPLSLRQRACRTHYHVLRRADTYFKADVQCPHFVAFRGMLIPQYGQSLVVAAVAGGGPASLFTCLIRRKIENDMIKKLIMVLRKLPYAMTGAPAIFAMARL